MNLYLSTYNFVVCEEHKQGVPLAQASPLTKTQMVMFATGQGRGCDMCQVIPTEGRTCAREACKRPLHPQWPAVYCSNECAWRDADDVPNL